MDKMKELIMASERADDWEEMEKKFIASMKIKRVSNQGLVEVIFSEDLMIVRNYT